MRKMNEYESGAAAGVGVDVGVGDIVGGGC